MGEMSSMTDIQWVDYRREYTTDARLVSYGLDFGFTNDPTAMVAIYEYDGGMIYDEIVYRTDLHMSDLHNLV
jgi:phage terminase large subunit